MSAYSGEGAYESMDANSEKYSLFKSDIYHYVKLKIFMIIALNANNDSYWITCYKPGVTNIEC